LRNKKYIEQELILEKDSNEGISSDSDSGHDEILLLQAVIII
jgi:hypothetical protein